MSSERSTVLVTGATGNIGTELVNLLSLDPRVKEVRAGTRDPSGSKAQLLAAINPSVIKPVAFTTEEADLKAAFDGIDVVVLIAPLIPNMVEWQRTVLDAASQTSRIVKVSVDAAKPESEGAQPGTPPADHWEGEEMVRSMDVEYAILRPTIFMQHFLIVPGLYEQGDDTFYLPSGEGKIALLDCRDIAYAAAQLALLDSANLPSEPIPLTGPEALSGEESQQRLSLATGRTFVWNNQQSDFEAHSEKLSSPVEVGAIYQAAASGAFANVNVESFEEAFNRRTTSFAKFVSDYLPYFKSK